MKKSFHEIARFTANPGANIKFYKSFLGFEPTWETGDAAQFAVGRLALKLKGEQLLGGDYVALHPDHFHDMRHAADTVAHPVDLRDQVDGRRDLGSHGARRQVEHARQRIRQDNNRREHAQAVGMGKMARRLHECILALLV